MSNSQAKTQSNSLGNASMAFPILMRLPDLRSAGEAKACSAEASLHVADCQPPALPPPAEIAGPAAVAPTPEAVHDVASKQVSSEEPKKTPPAGEPVTPAAQRRQRALERQRRQETEATPRSWWTSHAPIIAVGFLLALVITVVMARNNREEPTPAEQARMEPPTPELNIEMGGPSIDVPSSMGTPLAAPPELIGSTPMPPVEATPSKSSSKLPELLSAAPQAPNPEPQATTVSAEATLPPLPEERVAAKTPVSEPTLPPASSRASEFPSDAAAYPSTEAGSFGLNAPAAPSSSEAEPAYPSTSTPNSWR